MIEDFKCWLNELGTKAIERKNTQLKNTKRQPWKNKTKNQDIKKIFTDNGRLIEGIKPRSSNDRKAREWLYDLIWREYDSENNFIGVCLAMEIELSDMKFSGLIYDYNKLLQSDSKYKVFVFQQKEEVASDKIFHKLELCTKKYKSRVESEFLLSCWCWNTGTFKFKQIEVKP
ncbi:hypothetical protein [Gynuella sunshinyii]|nr:hypothetical protein [Gynuella sunshinyii]